MDQLAHLHLTVNARISPQFKQITKKLSDNFVKELLAVTDMKPLGSINWAAATDLDFPGQSFVQMITTSHSSLHYFSDSNEIYFDFYSCKFFDHRKIIALLDKTFGLVDWNGTLYHRSRGSSIKVEMLGSSKEDFIIKETVFRNK